MSESFTTSISILFSSSLVCSYHGSLLVIRSVTLRSIHPLNNRTQKILAGLCRRSVSVMRLRLPPFRRRVTVVMVVVMMMTLLVGDAGLLAGWVCGDVAHNQFRAIPFGVVATVIFSVSWFIQGLLATEGRMTGFLAGCLVQIFPSLTVVSVQASSTLRRTAAETGHGVAIRGCTVPVMLAASATTSVRTEEIA